jgi:peptidoglycan LD-endopeptidase LytH
VRGMKFKLRKRKILLALLLVFAAGYLLPERVTIPVLNANVRDWNSQSFWHSPWGKSGTHKGIDIFASKGTNVLSATNGVVLYTGEIDMGGKVVLVLGPKWRVHYYAHLQRIDATQFSLLHSGEPIGVVGDSGNAKGKAPHLHYTIRRIVPNPFNIDDGPQGFRRMWYINPDQFLRERHVNRKI